MSDSEQTKRTLRTGSSAPRSGRIAPRAAGGPDSRVSPDSERVGALLGAVGVAAEQLCGARPWVEGIAGVLDRLGPALVASRISVVEVSPTARGASGWNVCREWMAADGTLPVVSAGPLPRDVAHAALARWGAALAAGRVVTERVSALSPGEYSAWQARGTQAIVAAPVSVESAWWGLILAESAAAQDDGAAAELDALRATAAFLGSAIERGRMVSARADLEQHYRDLVERSARGIIIWRGQRVLFVNGAASEILSIKASELLDLTPEAFAEFAFQEDRAGVLSQLDARAVDSDSAARCEFRIRRPDGRTMWVEAFGRLITYQGQPAYRLALADITDRRRAEELQQSQLRFFQTLDALERALRGSVSPEQVLCDALSVVLSALQCDRAWLLYPCDPHAPTWRVHAMQTTPGYVDDQVRVDQTMTPDVAAQLAILLESNEPLVLDARTGCPVPPTIQSRDVLAIMALGLHPRRDQPWVLGVHQCSYARVWSESDQRLFKEMGARLTDALNTLTFVRDLQASEEQFRALAENSCDAILRFDPQLRYIYVNPVIEAQTGIPRHRFIGRTPTEVGLPSDFAASAESILRAVFAAGTIKRVESQLPSGLWIDALLIPEFGPDGTVKGVIAAARDISERRRSEEENRRYAQRLERILQIERATLASESPSVIANEALPRLRELIPCDRASVMCLDRRSQEAELLAVLVQGPTAVPSGHRFPLTEFAGPAAMEMLMRGQARPVADMADVQERSPIEVELVREGYRSLLNIPLHTGREFIGSLNFAARQPNAFTADHVQIGNEVATTLAVLIQQAQLRAEQSRAEQALRESEEKYRVLFERSADGMLLLDGDRFIDCNEAAWRMLGYTRREEMLNVSPWDLSPERQPDGQLSTERAREIIRLAHEHGTLRFEWDHRRVSGEVFPVEVLLTAVPFGPRRLLHVVWRDISARRRAEEDKARLEAQLRHSQKMEAVGRLAGGIAHDFNNILTAIFGNVELALEDLQRREPADSPLRREIQQIEQSAQRAAALTRQLLAFSRRQIAQPQVLDLNRSVSDLERMLRRLLTENIQLRVVTKPGLPNVRVDPIQLEQVILNLVVNARDAMPNGGLLVIETNSILLDETYVAMRTDASLGPHVVLSVSDNGHGIDARIMERIFEPFFTTKPTGEGTGLGLATVYGIVKQSGGHVSVYSEVGRGSTFRVYLPAVMTPTASARDPDAAAPERGGHETILVCEDDEAVRMLAVRLLTEAGYDVLAAENGNRALTMVAALTKPVHLLVTDVIMPDMNGRVLSETLTPRVPGLRTLFVSGYPSNVIAHHGVLQTGIDLLEKPFTRQTLLQRVRQALDDQVSPASFS